MTKKKYKVGEQVKSMNDFIVALENGKPFYWRDKFMAAGFIEHWSIVQIKNSINYGVLFYAVLE